MADSAFWHRLLADGSAASYRYGTVRSAHPAETLERLRPLRRKAGITRLADVTGLDWIGLPVYQAIRPASRNMTVAQGKGLTRTQAKVSALMEAFESFHAEEIAQPSRRETVAEMRRRLAYDPFELAVVQAPAARHPDSSAFAPPIGRPAILRPETPLDWIAATDLSTGEATWVPRALCELDFRVSERLAVPLFRATSNGLASGNTRAEALIHGLCEVIERDAGHRQAAARSDPSRWVDPSTVTSRLARGLLQRFGRAGLATRVVDLSGELGLPCFEAYLEEPGSGVAIGAGCHPSRTTALLRALTEAAQIRLTRLAGSRDDLEPALYPRDPWPATATAGEPTPPPGRRFRDGPTIPTGDLGSTLARIVERVLAATGAAPMAVDLTRPEFGLPVVFVIAPGLRLRPPVRI